MPFPEIHALCQFGGKLYAAEQWVTGFRIRAVPAPSPSEWLNWADSMIDEHQAHIQTFMGAAADLSSATTLEWVKLNVIGTDGKYVDTGSGNTVVLGSPIPGLGSAKMPPQTAVATTLTTANTRGRAHSGRMYLPLLAALVSTDGRMTTAAALTHAQDLKTLINNVNALTGPVGATDTHVAIFSRLGAGYVNRVTGVKSGRVVDTIRSRRRQLVEDWSPVQAVTS